MNTKISAVGNGDLSGNRAPNIDFLASSKRKKIDPIRRLDADYQWYLIQCKSGQDSRAEEHLARQGYISFRPLMYTIENSEAKKSTANQSLFPGYLFIKLSKHDNWEPIRSTRGVLTLVKFGGTALPVKDYIIEKIIARSEALKKLTISSLTELFSGLDDKIAPIDRMLRLESQLDRNIALLKILQHDIANSNDIYRT